MAFDDVADEGRLTIAVGARQIELATAIDLAIAVIVGFALEFPLVRHSFVSHVLLPSSTF
jgi:hypothetical protein